MAYRKSKCPACKEEAYKNGKDEICRECEKIFQAGKEHFQQIERGEIVVAKIDDKFTYGFYKPNQMPERNVVAIDGYSKKERSSKRHVDMPLLPGVS